jgi:predicted GIY-YIG superfamily endonuclease
MKTSCVFILASVSRTLYSGMTSDLEGHVYEHRHGLTGGFTSKYKRESADVTLSRTPALGMLRHENTSSRAGAAP